MTCPYQGINFLNESVSIKLANTRGFNYPADVSASTSNGDYWWSIIERKMLTIYLPGYKVSQLPIHINNTKSLLYHEYLHLDDYDSKSDKTKEGVVKHLEVYELQVNHSLFGLSTSNFKKFVYGNFRQYVEMLGSSAEFPDLKLYSLWNKKLKDRGR